MSAGGKKKKKQESSELDKAGTKTVIEFKDKTPVDFYSANSEEENLNVEKNEEQMNEVIETLPPEFQLPIQGTEGKASVSSVGSTGGSYKSERPDTRNAKSPRKIEGLAALNYSNQQQEQNLVSQIMSGNYGTNANGQRMTKEEFIAQQMAQTQALQNQLYGSNMLGGTNGAYNSGSEKENFFNASSGNTGNGTYLSKAALWDGTIIS